MHNIFIEIADVVFRAIGLVTISNWFAKNVIKIVNNRIGVKKYGE